VSICHLLAQVTLVFFFMIRMENGIDKSNMLDVNWRFLKYLGLSHVLMWIYGVVLIWLYFQAPPIGIARTVNAFISLMFAFINMIGIIGIFGKPVLSTEEEGFISWRCFGIAVIFFSSAGLFVWLTDSMDLSQITIWSRK